MKFLLPHYHPKPSLVHRVHPDAKIAFVVATLVACWIGVYRLPLAGGYLVLASLLAVAFVGLAIATNMRGALRVFLLPVVVGLTWVGLYGIVEGAHAWAHVRGSASDPLVGSLPGHVGLRLAFALRRVVALFCSAAAMSALVVSTSATDLRRAYLVPRSMVLNVELFMSMFTRFQWRVRRILHAHQLAGYGLSLRGAVGPGPSNAIVLLSHGLVVFVISVLRDIPSIFNYRALKKRIAPEGMAGK
jgi:energy-coupling factor transporter transmembrane protein EcfT